MKKPCEYHRLASTFCVFILYIIADKISLENLRTVSRKSLGLVK